MKIYEISFHLNLLQRELQYDGHISRIRQTRKEDHICEEVSWKTELRIILKRILQTEVIVMWMVLTWLVTFCDRILCQLF
jgi:hypothetical protein